MNTGRTGWQIVDYEGDSPFKKVRVRDDARVQAVVRHLLANECVALLGPPMNEKSRLLHDVADSLQGTGLFRPLYINLWEASSTDEAAFFSSFGALVDRALDGSPAAPPPSLPNARAFQNHLVGRLEGQDRHLALLIDHLQALPHDLVHSLLLALRSTYMERRTDEPNQFVAVVTGGMNLAGLSTGPTSPFNVARAVVAAHLSRDQSLALAQAVLEQHGARASIAALQRLLDWAEGDRYLVTRLANWSAHAVEGHRRRRVSRAVIERAARALFLGGEGGLPPIREAIRMIEEDPDSMLDVLDLLDHGALLRSRSRQMISRTGTDRLQLSGAVVLADGRYLFKNQAYRMALAGHFTPERVGHMLRIAGRWQEAIDYLAARLQPPAPSAPSAPSAPPAPSAPSAPSTTPATPAIANARPQLLEAIVQAIYATDRLEAAFQVLADGLRLGFGLAHIGIYQADPAHGQLVLVHEQETRGDRTLPIVIDLDRRASVEAQTFHYGNYALRGGADQARLVAALVAHGRTLGVVVVDRFVENRDPHELPEHLPDLLRFLNHAAGAVENVTVRAAYRKIGQAVLSASTLAPTTNDVLAAVSEALGNDYAVLYLLNQAGTMLEVTAGVGHVWNEAWQAEARLERGGRHPAVACLEDRRMAFVRGTDERLDRDIVARFGLRDTVRAFLPLQAGGELLGTLELGFAESRKPALTAEARGRFAAFADQVAIAVHNMELLRRTDEALARQTEDLALGRQIQRSMLPTALPAAPGWQFAAAYQAARIVGGDFYDFYDLPGARPRLGLLVADVADKGVPAALFMALSRTIIRTVALSGRGPVSTLLRSNELILQDSQNDLFLSAFYAVLEPDSGRLIYANAGHNRPLWWRAAVGEVEELEARGIIMGVFEEVEFEERRVDVAPGDVLVFYTDGVTEAMDGEGALFGEERLRRVVVDNAAGSAQQVLDAILSALRAFTAGAEQSDDVTCVVVRRE